MPGGAKRAEELGAVEGVMQRQASVDGVTGPATSLGATRIFYGAMECALGAACLEGGRSSLTVMV